MIRKKIADSKTTTEPNPTQPTSRTENPNLVKIRDQVRNFKSNFDSFKRSLTAPAPSPAPFNNHLEITTANHPKFIPGYRSDTTVAPVLSVADETATLNSEFSLKIQELENSIKTLEWKRNYQKRQIKSLFSSLTKQRENNQILKEQVTKLNQDVSLLGRI